MTLDEAIEHTKDVFIKKNTSCDIQEKSCGHEHLQLSNWLSELKAKRQILNEYKKILPIIISGFDKFFTEWEPYDKENLFPYESALMISYENIKKMMTSIEKSSVDKDKI